MELPEHIHDQINQYRRDLEVEDLMTRMNEVLDTVYLPEDYDSDINDPEDVWSEGDLFQKVGFSDGLFVGENYIDEEEYYGYDFRGKQRVMVLGNTGASDFFVGIWVGEYPDMTRLDEYPVYWFDLSCDEMVCKTEGNFREFVEKLLDEFREEYEDIEIYRREADEKRKLLCQFSTNLIGGDDYELKHAEERK